MYVMQSPETLAEVVADFSKKYPIYNESELLELIDFASEMVVKMEELSEDITQDSEEYKSASNNFQLQFQQEQDKVVCKVGNKTGRFILSSDFLDNSRFSKEFKYYNLFWLAFMYKLHKKNPIIVVDELTLEFFLGIIQDVNYENLLRDCISLYSINTSLAPSRIENICQKIETYKN